MASRGRRRSGWTILLPNVAAVSLLAGCGAAASTGPHDRFITAVDRIWAQAVGRHAGHPFPITGFRPEHPRAGQLPTFADYLARYSGLPRTSRALRELRPPHRDAAAWRALLRVVNKITDNSRRQIAAAKERDVDTFIYTEAIAHRLTTRLNDFGRRFGFTDSSVCGKVFG